MLSRPEHQRSGLHQKLLMDEFSRRKKRNSGYSLRAFSRDMGISLTAISGVMLKKRSLSKKNVARLAEKLPISPEQKRQMLACTRTPKDADVLELEEDQFQLISSWYYFAILSLACLPDTSSDPRAIAERLGISTVEAKSALSRLERLELLHVDGSRLIRTERPLHFSSQVPSSAVRSYHRENLELAMAAIEGVPMELRELTSITMPTDLARLDEARRQMKLFKQKMSRLLEGDTSSEVYTLALQLFPVSKRKPSR